MVYEEIDSYIYERVDWSNLHSEMSDQERRFIHGLIRHNKPKRLLELGVSRGGGSVNIINAILDDNNAKLMSIDRMESYYGDADIPIGFDVSKVFPEIEPEKWNLLSGVDASEILETLGELFDFAVIDTAHLHPVESLNFLCILPFLNDGAIVVFHDISLFYRENSKLKSLATRILVSALTCEKIFPSQKTIKYISDSEPVHNICAVIVTPELRLNIINLFFALSIPWEYYPVRDIPSIRDLLRVHYDCECLSLFDEAERANLAWRMSQGATFSVEYLAAGLKRLDGDVLFYGAGENMLCLLQLYRHCGREFKYPIWDINAKVIKQIAGNDVTTPDFYTDVDGVTAVITNSNVGVMNSVKVQLESIGCTCICGFKELFSIVDEAVVDNDDYELYRSVVRHINDCHARLLLADLTEPLQNIVNPTFFERITKNGTMSYEQLYNTEVLLEYYNDLDICSREYCDEVFLAKSPITIVKRKDVFCINDISLKYFNVVNSCRVTTDVPDSFENTIHFFGNCVAVGVFAEDQYTLESYLQRMLNETQVNNRTYRIINHSNWHDYKESLMPILRTEYQPNDIIVLVSRDLDKLAVDNNNDSETVKYIDLSSSFNRPHKYNGEVFFDKYHMNHRGYNLLAERIFGALVELPLIPESVANTHLLGCEGDGGCCDLRTRTTANNRHPDSEYNGLDEYLQYLQEQKSPTGGIVGSVVMNCNPFTLGHRYLIESAIKCCDFLYIFVVEEDKSFFPFSDRMKCVLDGVADLSNVRVLPSGKFIISSFTLPEYFDKDESGATIDATLDLELFATRIAPVLNIKKRFVGNEPFCQVTRQYNNAMLEILPKYGIELVIFDRMELDSEPISASRVRELLKNGEYSKLKCLVPEATLNYLVHSS